MSGWRAIVVGGGITGLATAERLARLAGWDAVLVLEASSRVGGKIVTETHGPFVVEGGPDAILASKPAGLALCRDLGLDSELRPTLRPKEPTGVRRSGRLHPMPAGFSGLVPSRVRPLLSSSLLSLPGRVRAALETIWPSDPAATDEPAGFFLRRRFGAEAYHWLLEPLLAGIYAGDGDVLSLHSAFPALARAAMQGGSVLRWMRRQPRPAASGFVTLAGGMHRLVEALVQRLPGPIIRTNTTVTAVTRAGAGYRVTAGREAWEADAVILAAPAGAASDAIAPLDASLGALVRRTPVASTAVVTLGFAPGRVPRPFGGHGYLVPRAARAPMVAATWTSNKFAGRAPEGAALVRTFFGRWGDEAVLGETDDQLIARARDDLRTVSAVTDVPALARVHRWNGGMPQYVVGHQTRLEEIRARLAAYPGLFVAGASYDGVGIPDCIASGWAAADAALSSARVAA